MSDEYGLRVIEHYKIQSDILWELLMIAQRLCPSGEWVFQFMAYAQPDKDGITTRLFEAVVTNGDDNVTSMAKNPGAAVAQLIYYMLNGSVFPLTGNGGIKYYPADTGWIRADNAAGGG